MITLAISYGTSDALRRDVEISDIFFDIIHLCISWQVMKMAVLN